MIFRRISLAAAICAVLAIPVAGQSVAPEEAGVVALQAGDFDKAASIFADALRRTPNSPSLHMGAGVAAHLHLHALPRWTGDTNFMTVVAETRILPEMLEDSWTRLRAALQSLSAEHPPAAA